MVVSATARMSGIDVSHFQQEIDWQQVKRVGISFAFVKASEGTNFADPLFRQNWRGTKSAGILRGAYHFFRPQLCAETQAQFFLQRTGTDPGELPPVLDLELLGPSSAEQLIEAARRWLFVVQSQLGCKPIVYTGAAFWRNTLKNSPVFSEFPLWLAHYTSAPNPSVPAAWDRWTFWQFSQQGRIAGIPSNVDLNVFNGSAADLEAFCLRRNQFTDGVPV